MQDKMYLVGIQSPNTEYALGEPNELGERSPLSFDNEKDAQALADKLGGDYVVIPVEHREPEVE